MHHLSCCEIDAPRTRVAKVRPERRLLGRKCLIRNQVYLQGYEGFESARHGPRLRDEGHRRQYASVVGPRGYADVDERDGRRLRRRRILARASLPLSVLFVAASGGSCGSSDGAPTRDAGADFSIDAPSDLPPLDAGADGARAAKRCADRTGALHCEDFADRTTIDEVVGAGPGGDRKPEGGHSFAFDGPLGDPARTMSVSIDSTSPTSNAMTRFSFPKAPPARLRLLARLRVDEMPEGDLLQLAFTRDGGADTRIYLKLFSGTTSLFVFERNSANSYGPGPKLVVGRWYDVELTVEWANQKAALRIDGEDVIPSTPLPLTITPSASGFRGDFGLYSTISPRSAARVTYDDFEVRED